MSARNMADDHLENGLDSLGGFSENTNNLAMIIKCSASPPSLEYITLARISISLWMQDSIRNDLASWDKSFDYSVNWHEIKEKVLKNASTLMLPQKSNEAMEKVVIAVGEEILNFLHHRICTNEKIKHIYLCNLRWTYHGLIDQVKTVSLLLENDGLSSLEKFELACSICSENDIYFYYLKKLPGNFINEYTENKNLRLMLFWTLHIRNDHETFFKKVRKELFTRGSDERYIFRYAFKAKSEVAMRCIYKKFPDSGIKDDLVLLTKLALQQKSYLCIPYLMSCMDPIQIKKLCIESGYAILKCFVSDWRLKCYFQPTAKCVLEFIGDIDLSNALEVILLCWNEKQLDNNECKKLLHRFIRLIDVNKSTYTYMCEILLSSLFALENVEAIQQLLRNGNTTYKTKIIYSTFGLKECFNLVTSGRFNLLNIFMQEMLQTEKEIYLFKNSFFEDQGFGISCSLISLCNYPILDQYLSNFRTEEQVTLYKKLLPYQDKGIIISNIIKMTTYMDSNQLKSIDEFLYWVFNGCIEKMSDFKIDVLHKNNLFNTLQEQFFGQILELAILGEIQFVNSYLSWASYSVQWIRENQKLVFNNRCFDICCRLIINKQYSLLDQFLENVYASNEIATFKFSLPAAKQGKIIKVIKNLAAPKDTKEELIIEFLNYSFEGNKEVVNCVKEMVVDQGKDIDNDCRKYFLEKVYFLMRAGDFILVDKYMQWAFSVEEEQFNGCEPPPTLRQILTEELTRGFQIEDQ